MTTYLNYDAVLEQMRSAGLLVDVIEVNTSRAVRVRVEGERERKGWYWVRELWLADRNAFAIVGSFGVWRGLDNGAEKIRLKGLELSDEQKAASRARIAEDRRRIDAERARLAVRAHARAGAMWRKLESWHERQDCRYLIDKKVRAHGTRATENGTLAVPMCDATGQVRGIQFIGPLVRKKLGDSNKQFWPWGMQREGTFHVIGKPSWCVLVCEGYATGASLHEATGLQVYVGFVANELRAAAEAAHKRHRQARILVCADDDFATPTNPGVTAAAAAALAVGGEWVAPRFDGDPVRADFAAAGIDMAAKDYKQQFEALRAGRAKLTDFNDLACRDTSSSVAVQIEAKIVELRWRAEEAPRGGHKTGGAGAALAPINSSTELFERFALIYGHNKSVFDFQERMLLSIEDLKVACSGREIWRAWLESTEKRIVRIENVGFDPSGTDAAITCNLWGGWPMTPREGKCERLLELLRYLLEVEKNHHDLYEWILRWLAYPLQYPGAKLKTALVFHGPQQVGKNFFFESYARIFGDYARVIDQDALEDKYNDCFSRKLFLIADEVVARQELWHVKNKLKAMITGKQVRINPKNVKSYWEANHCNLVFLSNETQPLVLERDDRRYVVVWTPPQLPETFYKEVEREVADGGIEALYFHLLHLDLGDFNPYSRPPMTEAKRELVELNLDSGERFWREWTGGVLEPVPVLPCKTTALYAFYREYCGRVGYARYAPEVRFLADLAKRTDARKAVRRYLNGAGTRQAAFIYPPGADPPADKAEPLWLGECVDQFKAGVELWREEGKGGL